MIIQAQDLAFNRKTLEQKKGITLMSLEAHTRKDSLKNLDSGLTPVIARIAAKNNNTIGIDLNSLRACSREQKNIRLARIRQNLELCRKAKARITIKGSKEGFYVLLSLGASTLQAKQALA